MGLLCFEQKWNQGAKKREYWNHIEEIGTNCNVSVAVWTVLKNMEPR